MYFNSDLPGENIQGKSHSLNIARAPQDEIYSATWDAPLPSTRSQSLDAPGRPVGQKIYQAIQDLMVGQWPDEDRRWKALQDYYFNAIRDCDLRVQSVLDILKQNDMEKIPLSFSMLIMVSWQGIISCEAREQLLIDNKIIFRS
ncbi:hypothetical protein [Polynucleobacter yangtzensis]|uniref:hypothetical protein n=1 Tax=Polynucleobacter yangtzensis TaxID=1743159 RepID=UPI00082E8427|nr:hypothetical protein [Polynucleobacter yangtzensis]